MEQSSISYYCKEWEDLFGMFNAENSATGVSNLKRLCIEGKLQSSRFRSICWKILLGCLPSCKSMWVDAMTKSRRQFKELKHKCATDPHSSSAASDLQYNNPLSQADQNPWQQYFESSELKACIKQDVERTFPELEYFQSPTVREMMIELLFMYARENPHISYKQGMHEILGPLIFVLYFDQETYSHASKQTGFDALNSESKNLLSLLTDNEYLEHDAYDMFTKIMSIIQPWYYFVGEQPEEESDKKTDSERPTLFVELFSKRQDNGPSSVLTRKLNWIGDNLVKHSDPQLYHHLEKLDIPPQIYGIRWLRLLFGREFPIQDLLFLWDAIFADGAPFALVDYIFVAMLILIRDLLLSCDYTGCLHYLMRYPPVTDVHKLLAVALHLQNPQKYQKPLVGSMQTNFSTITVAGRQHPNMQRRNEKDELYRQSMPEQKSSLGAAVNRTLGTTIQKLNKAAAVADGILESASSVIPASIDIPVVSTIDIKKQRRTVEPGSNQKEHMRQQQHGKQKSEIEETKSPAKRVIRTGSVTRQQGLLSEDEIELLKEQISCLQVRLNDVEQTSHNTADNLLFHMGALARRLQSLNVPPDDEAYTFVAYISRACRTLKGETIPELTTMDQHGLSPMHFRGGLADVSNTSLTMDMSSGNLSTVIMESLNTPVEIASDPTWISPSEMTPPRTADSELRSDKRQATGNRQEKVPRAGLMDGTTINGGRQNKVADGRPRLGAENELKEIRRNQPAAVQKLAE